MSLIETSTGCWYINARGQWICYDGKSTPWMAQSIDSWYFQIDRDLMISLEQSDIPMEAEVISAMVND